MLNLRSFFGLSGLALVSLLTACDSATTITGVTVTRDSALAGQVNVAGQIYELKAGEKTTTLTFAPVKVDHITVSLNYSNTQNEAPDAEARVATITSQIGMEEVGRGSNKEFVPHAEKGTVTIDPNSGDLASLVANCDNLFSASSDAGVVSVEFNGFKNLPSCNPASKVNLAIYDPTLIGKRDVSEGLAIFSEEEDLQRGQEFVAEYLSENKLLIRPSNDPVTQYVQEVAEKIVAASDKPDQQVTAIVIDMNDINAFAVPGGFIFVNTGLVKAAGSEAELVGVLGHEWSHVTCRHASRYRSVFKILTGGSNAQQREYEYEADAVGSQYAWNAGYEPWGLTRLFELIEKMNPEDGNSTFEKGSDHPSSYKRVDRVNTYSQLFYPAKDSYIHTTPEFASINAQMNTQAALAAIPPVDPKLYKTNVIQMFERHFINR